MTTNQKLLDACKDLVKAGWHSPDCMSNEGCQCDCGMSARLKAAEDAIAAAEARGEEMPECTAVFIHDCPEELCAVALFANGEAARCVNGRWRHVVRRNAQTREYYEQLNTSYQELSAADRASFVIQHPIPADLLKGGA